MSKEKRDPIFPTQSSSLIPQSSIQDADTLRGSNDAVQAVGLKEREQGSLEDRPDGLEERHAKGVT